MEPRQSNVGCRQLNHYTKHPLHRHNFFPLNILDSLLVKSTDMKGQLYPHLLVELMKERVKNSHKLWKTNKLCGGYDPEPDPLAIKEILNNWRSFKRVYCRRQFI